MACLLLAFLLMNSVNTLKATDCHEDFNQGKVENEIVAESAPMNKEYLRRPRRDATQNGALMKKETTWNENLAQKLNQLKGGNKKPYKSILQFRERLLKEYIILKKQGNVTGSKIIAEKINRTKEIQQKCLNLSPFRKKLFDKIEQLTTQGKVEELKRVSAIIKKTHELQDKFYAFQKMIAEGNTEGPGYKRQKQFYSDITDRIEKYMKALEAKGFPDDVIEDKVADKINAYWFKKAKSKCRPKAYELQNNFFAFQKMVAEGNTNGTEFERQKEIYSDITRRIRKYTKALKAKGFPDDVIDGKLAERIKEYWVKKAESKSRTRRDLKKQIQSILESHSLTGDAIGKSHTNHTELVNRTKLEFRDKMIERMKQIGKQGNFDALKKLSAEVKKSCDLQEYYVKFQKMLTQAPKRGDTVFQGSGYKKHEEHKKNILEYVMKELQGKNYPKDVVEVHIRDKINEYWYKHVQETST